jgi:hypothetical protein
MEMATMTHVLSESECGFHDCQVDGFRWHERPSLFVVYLQYITNWIAPIGGAVKYQFEIAEAELTFRSVSEIVVSFDWSRCAFTVQIDDLRILESRPTPSGVMDHHYRIDFSNPYAFITLWSTGFDLKLLHDPILCEHQYLQAIDR